MPSSGLSEKMTNFSDDFSEIRVKILSFEKVVKIMGRKPKPTAIKILEGNPGKRKLNPNEPKPKGKAPRCPIWLEEEARQEWRRLAKTLETMGVLTEADAAVFAAYCQAYGRWKQAEAKIADGNLVFLTPSGYPQQNPYLSIAQQNMRLMHRFATDFGLTPAARSRIIAGSENGVPQDEMDELLDD